MLLVLLRLGEVLERRHEPISDARHRESQHASGTNSAPRRRTERSTARTTRQSRPPAARMSARLSQIDTSEQEAESAKIHIATAVARRPARSALVMQRRRHG